jgi:toxin YoeB
MKYTLVFSEIALADIEMHKKSGNKALLKKLETLLNELMEHPKTGTGKPEKLKHQMSGIYSRRINQTHRLVYSIDENIVTVHVLSAWYHYHDK